ncbi:MAG: LLM class flavin-dependent oxidoreductase [Ilumatobacteraceae bacterium]
MGSRDARAHETELIGSATVTMAALAARTERIRIGAMVTPITRRRPQVFARRRSPSTGCRTVAWWSGSGSGSIAAGNSPGSGDIVDPVVRGHRLDEGARLLKELWSGETVDFHGEHFTADGVRFRPDRSSVPIHPCGSRPEATPTDRCDGPRCSVTGSTSSR